VVLVLRDFPEGHKALANIKKHHVNTGIILLRTLRIYYLSKWMSGMVMWCCRDVCGLCVHVCDVEGSEYVHSQPEFCI
jgi:hypothetical protein